MDLNKETDSYDIARHSKRVLKIYYFCIYAIIAGVLILLIQLLMNYTKKEQLNIIADSSEMFGPSYKGKTKDGGEYKINSMKAKDLGNDQIFLNSPIASLFNNDNLSNFILESVSGVYDNKNKILTLSKNVALDDKDGNSLSASEVKMDLEKNIIYSDNKIDLTGKMGKITAEGMEIKQDENVIIFKGKSKMIIKR